MSDLTKFILNAIPTSGYLVQLSQIWDDLGYRDEEVTEMQETAWGHISDLLKQMVEEVQEQKDRVIENIESHLKERATLCRNLNLEVPLDADNGLGLVEIESDLKNKLVQYQTIKDERMKVLEELKSREKVLMLAMGISRRAAIPSSIPSEEQLNQFREYLDAKQEEKYRLEEVFHSTRLAIKDIMDEMDIEPELDFEAQVIAGVDGFQLSQDNMTQLKALHQSLDRRLQEAKDLGGQLRENLRLLWDRLNEPSEVQLAFVETYVGHTSETIKALKSEIKRCEKKKRENIKTFVETVRGELADWWERCRYSDAQRAEFKHLTSTMFNEDLLDLHEQEVARLRQYYNDNRDVFQLVEQFQETWDRMIVLEDKAQQPNRFDNRGGQLLIEEKERKTIRRTLPKIENQLKRYIKQYEQTTGKPFLIDGEQVSNFLENKWETQKENKEREKMARKMRNQSTVDGHSSTKAPASSVGMKRKFGTPAPTNSTKRSKLAPSSTALSSATLVRPHISSGKKTEVQTRVKKVSRKIFNRSKTVTSTRSEETVVSSTTQNAVNVTSYSDFQDYVHKATSCRSSGRHRALRQQNLPAAATVARNTPTACRAATNIPRLRIATPVSSRSPAVHTPRFTPARGNLPFII